MLKKKQIDHIKVSNKFLGYALGLFAYLFLQIASMMAGDIIQPIYIYSIFSVYVLAIFLITDFLTYLRVFCLYLTLCFSIFSIWSIYFLLNKAYISNNAWYKYSIYLFVVTLLISFIHNLYCILKKKITYTEKFRILLYETGLTENKIDYISFFEKMKARGDSLSGNGIFLKIFMYISLPIIVFGKTGAYFLGTVVSKEFGVMEEAFTTAGLLLSLLFLLGLLPLCVALFNKLKYPTQEEMEAYSKEKQI